MTNVKSTYEQDVMNVEKVDGRLHIWGTMGKWHLEPVDFDRWFDVGDFAEFDSYNTSLFGRIVGFTEKTVTVDTHGLRQGNARLKMAQFIWRNYDFDVEQAHAEKLAYFD